MLFYIYLQIYIFIYLIIYRAVFRGVHPWSLFVVCLDHPWRAVAAVSVFYVPESFRAEAAVPFVLCLDHPGRAGAAVSVFVFLNHSGRAEAYIRPDSREGADGGASARWAVSRLNRSFRVKTTNTITLIISYLVFDFRMYFYIMG